MKTRITSASLPRLTKVLARLGVSTAATQEGVIYVQADGPVAAMTIRVSRLDSTLPGYAAEICTGNDARFDA
jgi:hypothetical protein